MVLPDEGDWREDGGGVGVAAHPMDDLYLLLFQFTIVNF